MWTIKPTIHNLFFQLLKTTFFSLLACDFSPKHYKKSTAQTSFYHLKICLIHPPFRRNAFRALTLLVGQQEGHPKGIRPVNMRGWWRWALVSPDGVELSWMVGVSASVNLPLHHKVQKFSSDTGSPRWSRKKDRKTVVCVCVCRNASETKSPFTNATRLPDFLPKPRCRSNPQQAQCLLLSRQTWTTSIFPSFDTQAHCCCSFHSATCPDWFCSTFYVEIPVAIVESEIQVGDFRHVVPLRVD